METEFGLLNIQILFVQKWMEDVVYNINETTDCQK